jgi:hypothetical protein
MMPPSHFSMFICFAIQNQIPACDCALRRTFRAKIVHLVRTWIDQSLFTSSILLQIQERLGVRIGVYQNQNISCFEKRHSLGRVFPITPFPLVVAKDDIMFLSFCWHRMRTTVCMFTCIIAHITLNSLTFIFTLGITHPTNIAPPC